MDLKTRNTMQLNLAVRVAAETNQSILEVLPIVGKIFNQFFPNERTAR